MVILAQGLLTGLILQVAVGPVFFYLMNIAIQQPLLNSLTAVCAVTTVDYIYIVLAVAGVGTLLNNNRNRKIFGNFSAFVLVVFGVLMVRNSFNSISLSGQAAEASLASTFLGVFLLTASSPLTIVFWMSVFASKSIELKLTKNQTVLFGVGAGAATFLFLGSFVLLVNLLKKAIPFEIALYANIGIGMLIIAYGAVRLVKINKKGGK